MRFSAFPEDLIAAQCAWERTYRSLADPANRRRTTVLRRRLLELSVQVWWHPYWRQAGIGQRASLRASARELELGPGRWTAGAVTGGRPDRFRPR